jgi:RNA polymerase sigma-70 factor (ECF subfamily)
MAPPNDRVKPAATLSDEDARLVDGLRRAEPGAAESLYRRLYPVVSGTLYRVLGPSEDREDLAQTTFERVIGTVVDGRFNGACGLKRWAVSIATHAAIDHLRADRYRRSIFVHEQDLGSWEAPDAADTERAAEARLELGRLHGILSRMKPLDARVLVLFDGLGYTINEAAAALGVSRIAAQSRLARARKRLVQRGRKLKTVDRRPTHVGEVIKGLFRVPAMVEPLSAREQPHA